MVRFKKKKKFLLKFIFCLGIKPKYTDWSTDDCLFFQKLTVNRPFYSIIKNIRLDKTVELQLIDTSDSSIDRHIDEILLEENRAEIIK